MRFESADEGGGDDVEETVAELMVNRSLSAICGNLGQRCGDLPCHNAGNGSAVPADGLPPVPQLLATTSIGKRLIGFRKYHVECNVGLHLPPPRTAASSMHLHRFSVSTHGHHYNKLLSAILYVSIV